MAREGQEGPRVRDHPDKIGEKAAVRKRVDLAVDTFFLVQKPPACPELNLAANFLLSKGTGQSGERIIIKRIEVEDYQPGQRVFRLKAIHVRCQSRNLWPVSNRVESDITPKAVQHSRVDVAIGAQVQLLGPALLGIQPAKEKQHVSRKLRRFIR